MTTQELKDKRVAAQQGKVEVLAESVLKLTERLQRARADLAQARERLEWLQNMPVTAKAEGEVLEDPPGMALHGEASGSTSYLA